MKQIKKAIRGQLKLITNIQIVLNIVQFILQIINAIKTNVY